MVMAAKSARFPWYDANWLDRFVRAQEIIAQACPERLDVFIRAFDVMRTRPDFKAGKVGPLFSDEELNAIREVVRNLDFSKIETHEAQSFGRVIVHDLPYFTELQHSKLPLVSAAAGEELEPCYNFLSLYSSMAKCPLHMDAPEAKWTLDLCIEQSEPWPIQFSNIVPWPVDFAANGSGNWEEKIFSSDDVRFDSIAMEPGEAILFSGSSQWHYRDPIVDVDGDQFCNLLFMHYVPKGTSELVKPQNWARIFGIAELDEMKDYNTN